MKLSSLLSSRLLFGMVIFDMSFIPMFHAGGLPYKLGYLVLIVTMIYAVVKRYKKSWENYTFIWYFFAFMSLSSASIVGSVIFNIYFKTFVVHETLRQILIYFLCSIGILYGIIQKKGSINYIRYFIPTYLLLNIILVVFYFKLGWFVRFYNLDTPLMEKMINESLRNQGLFGNSNITSLVMNIMYLIYVSGIKNGYVNAKKTLPVIMIVVSVFVLHTITGSRNQSVAALLLTLFLSYYILLLKRITVLSLIKNVTRVSVLLFIVMGAIFFLKDKVPPIKHGIYNLQTFFIMDKILGDDPNQSIYRPLAKLPWALEKFYFSPIIGSGADGPPHTLSGAQLHNDWLDTLVTSGIIGFMLLFAIVGKTCSIAGGAMIVPFLFPALTNSFIRAPQSIILYFILLGFIVGQKKYANDNVIRKTASRIVAVEGAK